MFDSSIYCGPCDNHPGQFHVGDPTHFSDRWRPPPPSKSILITDIRWASCHFGNQYWSAGQGGLEYFPRGFSCHMTKPIVGSSKAAKLNKIAQSSVHNTAEFWRRHGQLRRSKASAGGSILTDLKGAHREWWKHYQYFLDPIYICSRLP